MAQFVSVKQIVRPMWENDTCYGAPRKVLAKLDRLELWYRFYYQEYCPIRQMAIKSAPSTLALVELEPDDTTLKRNQIINYGGHLRRGLFLAYGLAIDRWFKAPLAQRLIGKTNRTIIVLR